ncbi:ribbon-helix-helix domain-containing protein [Temperatibacter marinus]|uniref:Ribbon-helix-helix domain-containing protein n=1 Tax=Temperatibacter marinus TaxID=1456591 RepID=A0AA52EIB4_9PROT|nr:ribbon-helix-helix domain-containing protein [Temperatibacter marinus]WND02834.1 ribbon-helix-helix domain-containing protein [Temperatibacter marinus]
MTISGHRTSISLESGFWAQFRRIAETEEISLNELIRQLDEARTGSLSGAMRVYVLEQLEKEISGD